MTLQEIEAAFEDTGGVQIRWVEDSQVRTSWGDMRFPTEDEDARVMVESPHLLMAHEVASLFAEGDVLEIVGEGEWLFQYARRDPEDRELARVYLMEVH